MKRVLHFTTSAPQEDDARPRIEPDSLSIPPQSLRPVVPDLWERRGRIVVADEVAREHPACMLLLLSKFLVTRCEFNYAMQAFCYEGVCAQFEVTPPMVKPPLYTALFNSTLDDAGRQCYTLEGFNRVS
jgi:hypothetical protein